MIVVGTRWSELSNNFLYSVHTGDSGFWRSEMLFWCQQLQHHTAPFFVTEFEEKSAYMIFVALQWWNLLSRRMMVWVFHLWGWYLHVESSLMLFLIFVCSINSCHYLCFCSLGICWCGDVWPCTGIFCGKKYLALSHMCSNMIFCIWFF